jgi:hypothetical protein
MRSSIAVGLVAVTLFVNACASDTSGPPCDGPDKQEPNDSPSQARDIGSFTDDPDSKLQIDMTVHTSSDVDWFKFKVFDRGIGGDPIITVSAPEGYEVTTWFTCINGNVKTFSCMTGKEVDDPDVPGVKGCQNEQPNGSVSSSTDCDASSDDDGTVLLRVKKLDRSNTCASAFNVTLEVE